MARILVVDDEKDIVQLITRFAEHEGYEVFSASDGAQAVRMCREYEPDAVIMDIMMPGMDGYTACKKIRGVSDVPVILLSALGAEYDKLMGFELGIDDYVVKPFSPKELMARIKAVLRRRTSCGEENREIRLGGLCIDTLGRTVYIDGVRTEMTAKEYELLLYFIKNRGVALTRENILNGVWGYDYFGDSRTVDWQVKLLRSKLGKYRSYIVTLRGMGYKFEETQ
ncbi:MAG: response regulator transcription factor [Eubacteriales bacterium]|nr:response regulator transcription factor [Eubacteriales bacterium]